MRKFLKPLGLLFCLGAIVSCSKKEIPVPTESTVINPLADYTVTPDPTDGFTFKFNNLGKDYTKLEWRFGDDTLNTETNPTHTYLATGTYLVDLKAISKTGDFSHKQVNINIIPDSVLQVTAEKTNVLYQLKFNAILKGTVKSILWTFNAVDPETNVTTTTTSTELSPLQSFTFGSFNNFSVTATTDKGSVVTISKSVTTDGIATDITQTYISYNSTNENTDQGPNEGSLKLVDGNLSTKFGFYKPFPVPEIATLQFKSAITVKLYAIVNGNDSGSDRDPNEWYVEGSNDGNNWDVLDHQVLTIGFADYLASIGQGSSQYNRFFYYPIANPKPYQYYRWRIVSTFKGAFQIDEFKLYK
ncbi:PKD domain-containing protein [Mucilaginibacter sp. UR6-11]|uniref:PKD domain-containing protein n=1 Tax=Mucilaginibacter sp. UR6-11 TaxID=1435644 RepID=UPI001E4E6B56|nr:PKD domain-containing protein [Mucilaginibacter sp. UR6-11]MCC8426657.1 PKD domain-containing protein [Mucilaginibacter sp. UR6-11]